MAVAHSTPKTRFLAGFNALDLVTIAVFAALYRALMYGWQAFNFLIPFNTTANTLVCVICAVSCAVIVRKFGVFFLFTLAAQAINLFVQGETLVAVLIMLSWGILPEVWVYLRLKAGANPFESRRDMIIAGALMGAMWVITVWGILFPVFYGVSFSRTVHIAVSFLSFFFGFLGGYIGFGLGRSLKGLIS